MAAGKKRFRRRSPRPVLLAELVDKRAHRWRFQALGRLEIIRAKWPEAAGDFVAAHVQPVRLVRKQLRLAADDTSWAAEMTYLGPTILDRLKELLPGKWVAELKVVQGEPMPPLEESDDTVRLAPENEHMRAQAGRLAALVDEPHLAERIRRAVLAWRRRLDANPELAVDKDRPRDETPNDGDTP